MENNAIYIVDPGAKPLSQEDRETLVQELLAKAEIPPCPGTYETVQDTKDKIKDFEHRVYAIMRKYWGFKITYDSIIDTCKSCYPGELPFFKELGKKTLASIKQELDKLRQDYPVPYSMLKVASVSKLCDNHMLKHLKEGKLL